MISVHGRFHSVFTASGLGVLNDEIIDPIVREALGGEYTLTFQYPLNGPAVEHIVLENIIAVPVPGFESIAVRQAFRIHEITTSIDGVLDVTCFHVFYDLAANLIADTFVVNKTAKAALDQILAAAAIPHGFTATSSDTATRASARIVRMGVAGALMDTGEDNSFASRWGGEITRDNWTIRHVQRRGTDTGVVIRDRKNLTGYESALDFSTVVTRILPVGYDGLLLPELYVDSPKLGEYVTPRIAVMRYGGVKAIKDGAKPGEDELPLDQAYAELRRLAVEEFTTRHVDEPSASYKVSFVDLSSTKEYARFNVLETVCLGDTLTVNHSDDGLSLTARVVAYEYNPLTGRYMSIELGSIARKFTSITRQITSVIDTAHKAETLAGVALTSADGKNTNHYGTAQPVQARLGDTWFKTNGEQVEIWMFQVTDTGQPDWVALATDINHAQLQADLDAARSEVTAATNAASEARVAAQAATRRIDEANAEIMAARAAATQAQETANQVNAQATALEDRLTSAANDLEATRTALTQAATDITTAQARAEEAYTLAAGRPSTDQVQTLITASANAKNSITFSTATPSGVGARSGDVWWRQVEGKLIGQWRWDGDVWRPVRVRHEMIASVDTASLVAGTATMNKAVVEKIIGEAASFGTLSANRVVIGDGTNLWPDPLLTLAYSGWTRTSEGKLTRTGTGAYSQAVPTGLTIPVTAGEKYVASFNFARSDPAQRIMIVVRRHIVETGSWPNSGVIAEVRENKNTVSSPVFTVPEGVDALQFTLCLDTCATPGVEVSVWDFQLRRQTPAVLIEDGAITAGKIAADTITGHHIQAGSITSDKLTIKDGFIATAMIKDAAITDAKISSLSATKITTGTLDAARIQAGSITSDKLTIKDGFISNAMIADAAITDAKISSLSAAKITTGTLAGDRIATGSITSDKLTIKDGFISNAMIKDAAITDAKIASLDAGRITTGTLDAARIGAKSITADKLTANAIQVGLAGWTSSIRISPYQIAWYNGTSLEGRITSTSMQFWYDTRYIGEFARRAHKDKPDVQGIVNQLAYKGDYVAWTYQNTSGGDYFTCLTLDPKGLFYGQSGIHLGADLRTNGFKLYTSGGRSLSLQDCTLQGSGTFPGWVSPNGLAKIVFHTYDVMVVTNGSYYNMTRLSDRVKDLMSRVNTLIGLLNQGWISSISGSGSNITWSYYSTTGLSTMSTALT